MPVQIKYERDVYSLMVIELRNALGMTQEEFARQCQTAVATVARWETRRPPKRKARRLLAHVARSKGIHSLADELACSS